MGRPTPLPQHLLALTFPPPWHPQVGRRRRGPCGLPGRAFTRAGQPCPLRLFRAAASCRTAHAPSRAWVVASAAAAPPLSAPPSLEAAAVERRSCATKARRPAQGPGSRWGAWCGEDCSRHVGSGFSRSLGPHGARRPFGWPWRGTTSWPPDPQLPRARPAHSNGLRAVRVPVVVHELAHLRALAAPLAPQLLRLTIRYCSRTLGSGWAAAGDAALWLGEAASAKRTPGQVTPRWPIGIRAAGCERLLTWPARRPQSIVGPCTRCVPGQPAGGLWRACSRQAVARGTRSGAAASGRCRCCGVAQHGDQLLATPRVRRPPPQPAGARRRRVMAANGHISHQRCQRLRNPRARRSPGLDGLHG
jgi:hypothetical protein